MKVITSSIINIIFLILHPINIQIIDHIYHVLVYDKKILCLANMH